ncbi:hypothetical protein AVEN_242783-1 [Araneus ventricosus]|uniref:Myb/SANT-like DNA-binding domain-containing protein n=1 Tax=Araneus ventricosus TaxID=182803 RepID=A0A4Y2FXL8_ARAVE|nr:hypothetical protein AVEN_242783-1 [Araneus ventricosus]
MARRYTWKHHETVSLIEVWEEKFFSIKNKRTLYKEIKNGLADRGVHKSIRQTAMKINNMTQKYRKSKFEEKQDLSWIYFRRLDNFMGKPASSDKKEIMDEDEKPEDIITLDVIYSQNPQIEIASIQGSSSQELLNGNSEAGFSNHHQNEVLGVLKHCLSVQEKVVDLMKGILDVSSKSGISDTERH